MPFHSVRKREISDTGVGDERRRAEKKSQTCFTISEAWSHARGNRKHFTRRPTRACAGIGNDKFLVVFAVRLGTDEGGEEVVYEITENRLLMITTSLGGQKELLIADRGVLLKREPNLEVSWKVLHVLLNITKRMRGISRGCEAHGSPRPGRGSQHRSLITKEASGRDEEEQELVAKVSGSSEATGGLGITYVSNIRKRSFDN